MALIANGELGNSDWIDRQLNQFDYLIAVDGGLNHLQRIGRLPDLLIGDLDSLSTSPPPDLELLRFPKEKDASDLELAIETAWSRGATTITLFAAHGGRGDHYFANLLLLGRYPEKIVLLTEQESIWAIQGEVTLSTQPEQELSLLPLFGPVSEVVTKGLQWELCGERVDLHHFSLSNRARGEQVHIAIPEGKLLISLQRSLSDGPL